MRERLLSVNYAVLPDQGEDSFAMLEDERGCVLCVADGCGGLGSRRYQSMGERTGAYLASRLVTATFAEWARGRAPLPGTPQEGEKLRGELENRLGEGLRGFAGRNCGASEPSRIVGSMQRVLPTTFCAVAAEPGASPEMCFLWAGDSRGYLLDADGLHQYTRDHARGGADPFESLYRDAPLSNLASADSPLKLSLRRASSHGPCAVVLATDGAFGCLQTPMEFEWLLLDTMLAAKSMEEWKRGLLAAFGQTAHDDATVLCLLSGFDSYDQITRFFAPRHSQLQSTYIAPVRQHGRDIAFAREKWLEYRAGYDRTEGERHERANWGI